MSDRDQGHILELASDALLNDGIRLVVDGGGCFVENKNFAPACDRAGEGNDLALA